MTRPLALLLAVLLALPAAAQSRPLPPELVPARLRQESGDGGFKALAPPSDELDFNDGLLISAVGLGLLLLCAAVSGLLPSRIGGGAATAGAAGPARPAPGR